MSSVRYPREAASSAAPSPLAPPPITNTSHCFDVPISRKTSSRRKVIAPTSAIYPPPVSSAHVFYRECCHPSAVQRCGPSPTASQALLHRSNTRHPAPPDKQRPGPSTLHSLAEPREHRADLPAAASAYYSLPLHHLHVTHS